MCLTGGFSEVTMKLHFLLFIVDSYLPELRISWLDRTGSWSEPAAAEVIRQWTN